MNAKIGTPIAADPELASLNFLNALEKMPKLIEKYELDSEKIARDIPVLQEVVTGSWKKEEQLAELKSELTTLDRQIQLSLKPIEQSEAPQNQEKVCEQSNMIDPSSTKRQRVHHATQSHMNGRQSSLQNNLEKVITCQNSSRKGSKSGII